MTTPTEKAMTTVSFSLCRRLRDSARRHNRSSTESDTLAWECPLGTDTPTPRAVDHPL